MSDSYVSFLENGTIKASQKVIDRFADAFQMEAPTSDWSIYHKPERPSKTPKAQNGRPSDIAYENLAIAIIKQAKLDYESIKRRPTALRTKEEHQELDDLRRFFRSGWFDLLCMKADSQVIRKEIGIK